MDLLDYQPYLLFMLAGASLITAIITGGKYAWNRYINEQNKRIDGRIDDRTRKNTKKLLSIERQMKFLIDYIVPKSKRNLIKQVGAEIDE